jgi:hypothetical protein
LLLRNFAGPFIVPIGGEMMEEEGGVGHREGCLFRYGVREMRWSAPLGIFAGRSVLQRRR